MKKSRWTEYVQWRGVLFEAKERYNQAQSELYRAKMKEMMHESVCTDLPWRKNQTLSCCDDSGRKADR